MVLLILIIHRVKNWLGSNSNSLPFSCMPGILLLLHHYSPLMVVSIVCLVCCCRQLIYNYPEQLFADAGVMAIEHADFEGVERLALVTGETF